MTEQATCVVEKNEDIQEYPEMRVADLAAPQPWVSAGLCSTCNNASTCAYFSSRGPVQDCELFDDRSLPTGGDIKLAAIGSAVGELPAPDIQVKGLCMNCEEREVCVHADPNPGIWHCEQFH
ncbi:MAG: hypothetical protein GY867_06630 [bacterium]|nr:hypothetical protein [bacterium]